MFHRLQRVSPPSDARPKRAARFASRADRRACRMKKKKKLAGNALVRLRSFGEIKSTLVHIGNKKLFANRKRKKNKKNEKIEPSEAHRVIVGVWTMKTFSNTKTEKIRRLSRSPNERKTSMADLSRAIPTADQTYLIYVRTVSPAHAPSVISEGETRSVQDEPMNRKIQSGLGTIATAAGVFREIYSRFSFGRAESPDLRACSSRARLEKGTSRGGKGSKGRSRKRRRGGKGGRGREKRHKEEGDLGALAGFRLANDKGLKNCGSCHENVPRDSRGAILARVADAETPALAVGERGCQARCIPIRRHIYIGRIYIYVYIGIYPAYKSMYTCKEYL